MLMKTTGKMSSHGSGKAINGRWTREEHELFLKAFASTPHPRAITRIPLRLPVQLFTIL